MGKSTKKGIPNNRNTVNKNKKAIIILIISILAVLVFTASYTIYNSCIISNNQTVFTVNEEPVS